MKKKRNLGITLTALFMVIALALTGCGQKGEQNAGATGSGDGNGEVVNTEPGDASVSPHAICTKCLENSNFCRLLFYLCLFVLFKNFGCKNLKHTIFEPLKLLFSLL